MSRAAKDELRCSSDYAVDPPAGGAGNGILNTISPPVACSTSRISSAIGVELTIRVPCTGERDPRVSPGHCRPAERRNCSPDGP